LLFRTLYGCSVTAKKMFLCQVDEKKSLFRYSSKSVGKTEYTQNKTTSDLSLPVQHSLPKIRCQKTKKQRFYFIYRSTDY
jgi:hypothetical protein